MGTIMFALVISSVLVTAGFYPSAHAEIIPTKAEFAYNLEEILGHFWALEKNLDEGNAKLALVHATHPIAELYDYIKWDLQKKNPDLDAQVQQTLLNLKDKANTTISREEAQQAIDDAKDVIEIARSTIVGDELSSKPAFKIQQIAPLLYTSVYEYGEAVDGGQIVEMAEFQDGSAFVWRAERIFEEIKSDISADDAKKIAKLFADIRNGYEKRAAPDEIEKRAEKIIFILDKTLSVLEEDAQEHKVPDWIRTTVGAWSDGISSDSEFLNAMQYLIGRGIIPDSSHAYSGPDKITIGFIPVEKAVSVMPQAEALESYLEKKMPGVDVEITIPTNYETIIEGMRFGHIDAAFMDTGPAWITHKRTGAEVILAEVVSGKINYQATVWTLATNTDIHEISDVVGKRVAFTSITGSSGFVRPMGTLVTQGHVNIDGNGIVALERALGDSFESHTFAGGYKAALTLLLNGNVDVAFGSDIAPQKYLEAEDRIKLRPVATIGPVPSHVFIVSDDLPDTAVESLTDALVGLNTEETHILEDLYGADALLPTSTEQHIGDFGKFINALTGLDQLILDKYNKSK